MRAFNPVRDFSVCISIINSVSRSSYCTHLNQPNLAIQTTGRAQRWAQGWPLASSSLALRPRLALGSPEEAVKVGRPGVLVEFTDVLSSEF